MGKLTRIVNFAVFAVFKSDDKKFCVIGMKGGEYNRIYIEPDMYIIIQLIKLSVAH